MIFPTQAYATGATNSGGTLGALANMPTGYRSFYETDVAKVCTLSPIVNLGTGAYDVAGAPWAVFDKTVGGHCTACLATVAVGTKASECFGPI